MPLNNAIQRKKSDTTYLLIIAIGTLLLRYLTLTEVNVGGDNIDYWYFAKAILKGYPDYYFFHRSVRWSIILPTAFIQLIFGTGAWVIYLPPVFMSVLLNFSVFFVARRLFGRKTAYLAVPLVQFYPFMYQIGSQLFLAIFSMNYILLSYLFLHKFIAPVDKKEEEKGYFWFFLSAGFMFLGYLTKITNLYFVFPWLIILWKHKRFKPALYYGLFLLGLYLIEHIAYYSFLGESLGRIGIISSTHVHNNATMELGRGHADGTFLSLFGRYKLENFPFYWQIGLWGGLLSAAVLLIRSKKQPATETKQLKRDIRDLLISIIIFLIFMTFGVTSVKPFAPFENYHSRYFVAIFPFLAMFISRLLIDLGMPYISQKVRIYKKTGAVLPFALCLAGILFLSLVLPLLPSAADKYLNHPFKWNEHILAKVINWDKEINEAAEKRDLLRCWVHGPSDTKENRNSIKSLDTVNRLYLHLDKDFGAYPVMTNELPDGTSFAWIAYDQEDKEPTTSARIYNFLREPFDMESWDK